jgi:hypothetical protein
MQTLRQQAIEALRSASRRTTQRQRVQFTLLADALCKRDDIRAQRLYDALSSAAEKAMSEDQNDALETFFSKHLDYVDAQRRVQKLYDALK